MPAPTTPSPITDLQHWFHYPDPGSYPIILPKTNRADLAKWLARWGLNLGVEIGVESGLYSRTLLRANPNLTLHSIDQWKVYPAYRDHVTQSKVDTFYAKTQERLAPFGPRSIIHRASSMDAVRDFQPATLDFAYIDANHSFDYVMQDLIEWSKRVRRGGVVAGHDYNRRKRYEDLHVVEAVQAYTNAHNIRPWFTTSADTEVRSFFWVKP